jgi:hypothetical protein
MAFRGTPDRRLLAGIGAVVAGVAGAAWLALRPAPEAAVDAAPGETPGALGVEAVGTALPSPPGARPPPEPVLDAGGLTGEVGGVLYEAFRWPLDLSRTGRPARETAVGYLRADGSSAGIIVENAKGAMVQSIPGTEGPDARAVAERWLQARGWTLR